MLRRLLSTTSVKPHLCRLALHIGRNKFNHCNILHFHLSRLQDHHKGERINSLIHLLVQVLIVKLGQYVLWLTVTVLAFHWHGTQMIQWLSSQSTHGIVMVFKTNRSVFNFQRLSMMVTIL